MASPWLRKKSIPRIPNLYSHSFAPSLPSLLLFPPFPAPPHSTPFLSQQGQPLLWTQWLTLICRINSQILSSRKLNCLLGSRPIILRICWMSPFMCPAGISAQSFQYLNHPVLLETYSTFCFFIFVNSANITLVMQTKNIWLFALPHSVYLTHFLCSVVSWIVSWPLSLLSVAIVITQVYAFSSS